MSPVPGDDVPRGLRPEQAAPFQPVPDVAHTPEEAREIDYSLRASVAGIWLMVSYTIPLAVLAFLLAHAAPVLFAIPAGLLLLALLLHIYLRRTHRRRLAAFISPISGQIEIPGGRRELKLRRLSRRKG